MSPHYSHSHFRPPVGPGKVYIHGPAELEEGVTGSYSCYSDEANPPSDISVSVIGMVNIVSAFILTLHFTTFPADQRGTSLPTQLSVSPKMKGSAGFSSRVDFKFQVSAAVESVVILCSAENSENAVTEQWPVNVKSKICLWRVV